MERQRTLFMSSVDQTGPIGCARLTFTRRLLQRANSKSMSEGDVKFFVGVHDCVHEPLAIEVSVDQDILKLYEEVRIRLTQYTEQVPNEIKLYLLNTYIDPQDTQKPTLQSYNFSMTPVVVPNGVDWTISHTMVIAVAKSCLPLYIKNDRTTELAQQLTEFHANGAPNRGLSLSFPPTMSSQERKFVHAFSEQIGLNHQSGGKGDQRYVKVTFKKEKAGPKSEINLDKIPKKDSKLPRGMSEIIEGSLFLGSGIDANDRNQMKSKNITHILNVCKEWQTNHKLPYEVKVKHLLLEDVEHQVIHDEFDSSFEFINAALQEEKRVLVHCAVGKSRSASFVIAYLMKSRGFSLKQAYDHVFERRPIIKPNDGFIRQLMLYEKLLHDGKFTDQDTGLSTSLPWTFTVKEVIVKKKKEENEEMIALCQPLVDAEITDDNMSAAVNQVLGGEYASKLAKTLIREYSAILFEKYRERLTEGGDLDPRYLMKMFQDGIRVWYVSKCSAK
jgi:protein-tyrosine phosphatase